MSESMNQVKNLSNSSAPTRDQDIPAAVYSQELDHEFKRATIDRGHRTGGNAFDVDRYATRVIF